MFRLSKRNAIFSANSYEIIELAQFKGVKYILIVSNNTLMSEIANLLQNLMCLLDMSKFCYI